MEKNNMSFAELKLKNQNEVALLLFGMTYSEAIQKKVCLCCKREVPYNELSDKRKDEYLASGVCAHCQIAAAEHLKFKSTESDL